MLLQDIFSVLLDTTYVNILDLEDNVVAKYDGREGVPTKYNKCTIVEMYNNNNVLNIVIDL